MRLSRKAKLREHWEEGVQRLQQDAEKAGDEKAKLKKKVQPRGKM